MPIDQSTARANARRLATLRGLTLKDLAEKAGVSASALYNWQKRGSATELGPKALVSVAEALGVTTEALFSADLAEGGDGALDRNKTRPHTPANVTGYEEARESTLREIDRLLGAIDDPDEQERAADIILAALRAARDAFERRRTAAAGPRGPASGPARNLARNSRRPV